MNPHDNKPSNNSTPATPGRPAPDDRLPVQIVGDHIKQLFKELQQNSSTQHGAPTSRKQVVHTWPAYLYLILTIVLVLMTMKGIGNPLGGWLLSGIVGAYTLYLFRGGRYVVLNVWVMLAPLLLVPLFLMNSSPVNHSVSSLKTMKCSDFAALDESDRSAIADKLFKANYAYANSLGSENTLLSIETYCGVNPSNPIGNVLP